MAKITVTIRTDRGELGAHPKYGPLRPGEKITIDEEDFGSELFERPAPEFLSPHERKDRERAAELNQRVGAQEPPASPGPESDGQAPPAVAAARKTKEVSGHA